jgi:hypothetical protein
MMSLAAIDFESPATEDQLQALAGRLRGRNFEVVIVDSLSDIKAEVMKRLPEGVLVHSGKSKTLEDAGVFAELMESDRWTFVRKQTMKMDRATQRDEMRRAGAAPDVMLGSVQAITVAGQLVVATASGSQVGPHASGAGRVVLVIGSQKVVPHLDAALRRINDHVTPYEDARLMEQLGVHTMLTRVLIMEREFLAGRTTVILVRQPVGV